ncbi:PREDICTED: NADPH-dependent diflavin oxidoreductase 1 isoform X2 [Nicrophorus vespilloides]|uniref:NADPH-dependent diflavin oxidoreductase 1 n=1 Tax=Nicrophorus vespilloides TaxID=110193 RepID=A0ABM1NIP1_NICVS|nr:PREDICTED: NADPH-dependent diflavin oxidoreductase 1 isoform X2 [Nicrophorus vespilloides]
MSGTFVNEKLTVLYGSQTGNAQDLAERIWRESKRFHFAGTGEEPDNMKQFWKFLLRRSLPADSLKKLNFAVLGLGDSSYVKYNFVAKRLNKRLGQLGAHQLIPIGLGDDQHDLGYDGASDPWIEALWINALNAFPLPQGVSPLDRNQPVVPRWNVTSKLCLEPKSVNKQQSLYYSTRTSKEFFVTIIDNVRVTTDDHFQDVRLIKLKTNGQEYNSGDVVVLRPRNLPSQVAEFQRILLENDVDIPPETIFNLSERSSDFPVPPHLQGPISFQQLCEEYFDLTSIPRRHTFSILAQLTDSEIEKEKCLEFTTAEGQDDLYNYCNRPRRNITEVLEDFRHATKNITKDILFELLQPIKPRDFSIASSCRYHRDEIHILVAVVKYKTKLTKERLGLCSNYLADLKSGDEVSVWLKKGSFKFPLNPEDPAIMVGPGTGVAPFRNFIFQRVNEGVASADNLILFFGCRSRCKDFYCKDEYESLQDEGMLHLICAFSRDQDDKIYVQHKIAENAKEVWRALATRRAHIFVAGNSKNMPQEVRSAFARVCVEEGGLDEEKAEAFLAQMEKTNQYQTETWS